MIKRMTKTTSLLVAAAAMVSLVPATGVNAAEKLATKEGTIETAIAFEDGKYLFSGYKSEDDDDAIYFNNGTEDKALEDLDDVSEDDLSKYGKKYVLAEDGDDQYMVDLSTGKVSDEDTKADTEDMLRLRLKKTLSKTNRYEDGVTSSDDITLKELDAKFAENWYEYTASTGDAVVTGYTDESAKYVDASVVANLYVFDGERMVKVEEFGEEAGENDVVATLVEAKTLAQDEKYIYRTVKVALTNAKNIESGEAQTEATYLQKISKEDGDKKDDAYLPKSVASYVISADLDDEDADKAVEALEGTSEVIAKDGSLYVVKFDDSDDEVKVTKLVMKRNQKVEAKLESRTKRVDVSVVKYSDDVTTDAKNTESVSIDVEGNVWALYKGEISKSVKGGDFEVVYTCDRTLDRLDVYNENSLIAWDSEGEIYTTVGEVEAKEEEKKEEEKVEVKTGWDKQADGTWVLYDATGAKVTGWTNVGGVWYYMNTATGVMQTGWVNDNGTWYYMQASGAMKTGWVKDGANWYYMQANGVMKTGWLYDNGSWYYLNTNGTMATNTTVGGYTLGANGAWAR